MDRDSIGIGCLAVLLIAIIISLIVFVVSVAESTPSGFERRDRIVQECLLNEFYTREECILLASGE